MESTTPPSLSDPPLSSASLPDSPPLPKLTVIFAQELAKALQAARKQLCITRRVDQRYTVVWKTVPIKETTTFNWTDDFEVFFLKFPFVFEKGKEIEPQRLTNISNGQTLIIPKDGRMTVPERAPREPKEEEIDPPPKDHILVRNRNASGGIWIGLCGALTVDLKTTSSTRPFFIQRYGTIISERKVYPYQKILIWIGDQDVKAGTIFITAIGVCELDLTTSNTIQVTGVLAGEDVVWSYADPKGKIGVSAFDWKDNTLQPWDPSRLELPDLPKQQDDKEDKGKEDEKKEKDEKANAADKPSKDEKSNEDNKLGSKPADASPSNEEVPGDNKAKGSSTFTTPIAPRSAATSSTITPDTASKPSDKPPRDQTDNKEEISADMAAKGSPEVTPPVATSSAAISPTIPSDVPAYPSEPPKDQTITENLTSDLTVATLASASREESPADDASKGLPGVTPSATTPSTSISPTIPSNAPVAPFGEPPEDQTITENPASDLMGKSATPSQEEISAEEAAKRSSEVTPPLAPPSVAASPTIALDAPTESFDKPSRYQTTRKGGGPAYKVARESPAFMLPVATPSAPTLPTIPPSATAEPSDEPPKYQTTNKKEDSANKAVKESPAVIPPVITSSAAISPIIPPHAPAEPSNKPPKDQTVPQNPASDSTVTGSVKDERTTAPIDVLDEKDGASPAKEAKETGYQQNASMTTKAPTSNNAPSNVGPSEPTFYTSSPSLAKSVGYTPRVGRVPGPLS